MKNNYIFLLFGLLLSQIIFAQTTLYSEDFTGQNGKGIVGTAFFGTSTDLAGVDWTIDVTAASIGADFFGGNADYFRVTSESFSGKDTDGNAFWLSPSIDIVGFTNVTITLDASTSGTLDATDSFQTEYRIDGGTWTTAATNGNLTDDFNLVVSQTGLSGSTIELRVRVDNDSDDEITTFDNVLVQGTALCPEVSSITASSITSDSAILGWTAGGTEGGWEIVIQAPGTGAPAGSGTAVGTSSYVATSLTASTSYEVYVRADCSNNSNGFSLWTGPYNFTTPLCSSGTTSYIFTEEFNAVGSWTGNFNGGNGTWEIPDDSGSGQTGPNNAFSGSNFMNYEASGSTTATASAVSPAINLSTASAAELTFYLHAYGSEMGTLNVGVSTSSSGPFTTLYTQSGQVQTSGAAAWQLVTVGLSTYAGQTIHIEFSHTGTGGYRGDMSIDYMRVQTCTPPAPVTYTYNGSWSPSDPNGASNSSDTINIVSGNAILSSNTSCDTATVSAGAGLSINSGVTLITNSLTLESSSSSYSSLILNGTISGTVNYERHVNIQSGGNDLISAPLSGQTFGAFATANSNIFSNPSNTSQKLFGPWSKVTNEYLIYDTDVPADANTTLDAGIGYRAASTNNSTFTFSGTVNTGTVSRDLIYSGPHETEWNLVGNPYPSYLNVQNFLNHDLGGGVTNMQLFDFATAAIYGYDGDVTDGWIIYNLATITASTVIAPGQGFFVSADPTKVAAYDLEFTPAMRSTGTSDDFIAGRNAELTFVKLNLSTSTKVYRTDFYFNSNASLGLDYGYDAEVWGDTPPEFAIYSHLVQNDSGKPMALQALNSNDISDVTIPLGVNAIQGEQLTFSISNMNIPASVKIYLEDTVTNTITLLNEADYIITPNTELNGTGRFYLRTSNETLSMIDNSLDTLTIFAINKTKEIVINGQLQANTLLSLYDIQGRNVLTVALNSAILENRINVANLSNGVYVATVKNNDKIKTQKLVIN